MNAANLMSMEVSLMDAGTHQEKTPNCCLPVIFVFFFEVCSLTCPQGRFAHFYLSTFFAEKNANVDMQLASGGMAWSHWVRPESQGRLS